jgi:hypothetical protein
MPTKPKKNRNNNLKHKKLRNKQLQLKVHKLKQKLSQLRLNHNSKLLLKPVPKNKRNEETQ